MESALGDIEILRKHLRAARDEVNSDYPRAQSLLNLNHYMLLRQEDRTDLQEKLFMLSLSSLGRSYAHVAASIDTLYDQLSSSLGNEEISEALMAEFRHLSIADAISIASKNSKALFGGKASSKLSKQITAVMVTLPSHAAENDGLLIRQLADSGVNVFRINTAHDDSAVWRSMAEVIAAINTQRDREEKIKIFIDLAGPKIRTGTIREVEMPIEIGSNKQVKEVMIYSTDAATKGETTDSVTQGKIPAQIAVDKKFFKKIGTAHPVEIIDANHKKALITLSEVNESYARGVINKKVFVNKKTKLKYGEHEGKVQNLQMQKDPIRLFVNDRLIITENEIEGSSPLLDGENNIIRPALISCSLKGMLSSLKVGEKIFIDDGKIGGVVIENNVTSVTCKVVVSKPSGTLLKEEKGINFPDTYIQTSALTALDRTNALEVLEIADSLSLSFCQSAQDVHDLQRLLEENKRTDIGIIAKIETQQGVVNMPEILKQLLQSEKSGVMIARGDLAIEVGFENMAYMQEALLDICDAAHMPVIWATQVLESKMKNNLPSRAEVTDAAMAGRAECVMLNKGAFAIDTIDVLTRILNDMHLVSKKNRQLLKKETLWC
ncbi:pyruvate kinase [Sulfuricurvum sp.]|jgi:pyruvate kinase|uniref:pyruvate kinase n=1 Tax=Sulfuricurvum sp. TaxID=2025608 RepID=UPI0025E1576A|nr:pyruvate kinase [Sulfuricurvum sp.]